MRLCQKKCNRHPCPSPITHHVSPITLSPNHHHAGRHTAAHVEGEKVLRILNLIFPSGPGELAIRFDDLTHTRGANGMTVADQSPARIDNRTGTSGSPAGGSC